MLPQWFPKWTHHAFGGASVVLVLAVAGGVLWLVSALNTFLSRPPATTPVVLAPTAATASVPVKTVTAPIQVLQLDAKSRKLLEQLNAWKPGTITVSVPAQPGQQAVVASDTVPHAPKGGTVTASVDSTGKVTETFKANPYHLFELGEHTDLGVFYRPIGTGAKDFGLFMQQDLFSVGGQKYRINFAARAFDTLSGAAANRGLEILSSLRIR